MPAPRLIAAFVLLTFGDQTYVYGGFPPVGLNVAVPIVSP